MKKTLAASALTLGMLGVPFATPAFADPTDLYPAPINGGGSDTTFLVMKELDAAIPNLASWDLPTDANLTSSWDTTGTAGNTGAPTDCNFVGRIQGSTAGRIALANSLHKADNCFQFARTSSRPSNGLQATGSLPIGPGDGTVGSYAGPSTPVNQSMLPIALAVDGLGYAFRSGSGTPRDLTLGQLRSIFHCVFTGTVDGRSMSSPTIPNQPLIPTDLSGTRSDWLKLMANNSTDPGFATGKGEVLGDALDNGQDVTLPSCISDGPGDSVQTGEFSEHNGNVLTHPRQIVTHGVGQWIAQGRAFTGDFRGLAQLGYINGNVPLAAYDNPAGNLTNSTASGSTIADGAWFRTVYNAVPTAGIGNATYEGVFGIRAGGTDPAAGSGGANDIPAANSGAICTNDTIILNNGMIPVC